jgi:hypothetical protein
VIFRCPATSELLVETSPKICKPYFQLKSTLSPHLAPYYNTYAAPYVDYASPYYEFVERNVITPAAFYGQKYGAPRVAQVQAIGKAQWEKQVQPQVAKLNRVIQLHYNNTLAPHIQTATTTVSPYIKFAKDNALQTYHATILPTYTALQPYAQYGYVLGRNFTVNTGIPYAKWAWESVIIFLDRTIWPKVKILYGENVEPQLVRIGERLGRYRDGKKLKAAVEEVEIISSASSISSTFSPVSSSIAPAPATTTSATSSASTPSSSVSSAEAPANTPLSEEEQRANAQKIVADDLKTWQEKFAKAADHGSDELDQRISEITDRAIKKQAHRVGNAHLIQLEETTKSEMQALKASIISIVKLQYKEDDITAAVRKAGIAIRDKAQAVRTWRQKYDQETVELVAKAAEDTFQIIDHIRDLGLQEIGMRWAWTDGITHKDWAKYHDLKNKFDEWRHDVEEVATAHPGLADARAASEDIESRAMSIAEDAAKELLRLKEVGRWKLLAGDASDDFSTKHIPPAAPVVAQKIIDEAQEANQGTAESLSSVASPSIVKAASSASASAASVADYIKEYAADATAIAESAASSISSIVAATPQGSIDRVISAAPESANSATQKISNAVIGTSQKPVKSLISAAQLPASSIIENVSNSVIGTSQASVESIVPTAEVSASSVGEEFSSAVIETPQGKVDSVISAAHSSASSIGEKASSSVVGASQGSVESLVSAAQASASSIDEKVSSSVLGTSQGKVESVISVAQDSASSIVQKASSYIVPSSQATAESVASIASSSLSSLVEKASSAAEDAVSKAASASSSASDAVKGPTLNVSSVAATV